MRLFRKNIILRFYSVPIRDGPEKEAEGEAKGEK